MRTARDVPTPVAVQEQHDLANYLLLGPARNDPLRALRADAHYLAQARRLLFDVSNTASPKALTSFFA
jgi:hypothetical protein